MPRPRSHKRFTLAVAAFKSLARYTWKNLASRHSLKMRWPEVAITNELVDLLSIDYKYFDVLLKKKQQYGNFQYLSQP